MGIDGRLIRIEVDASQGLPSYDTVGLPDKAVTESRERVRAAIRNSGYVLPPRRITVNLAPAALRKVGSVYDLPIAVALLVASESLREDSQAIIERSMIVGELALGGEVRAVHGALSMAIKAREEGMQYFFCPKENAPEAANIGGICVVGVESLRQICDMLEGQLAIVVEQQRAWNPAPLEAENDFSLIRGQFVAKRAAEIAAAGGHNMLMIGHPGGGKTMLARAIPGILPDLRFEEALEISKIHSLLGQLDALGLARQRPFVAPHHNASMAALIGGGALARPGAISMAHHGVLFLDEMPEFQREVLEALRQPLEDGFARIARVQASATYPASFMLVAAMNPCPCGYFGSRHHRCTCSEKRVASYRGRISGPLMDRIDLFISMQEMQYDDFYGQSSVIGETSDQIRSRVNEARNRQWHRLKGSTQYCNGRMQQKQIEETCVLDAAAQRLFRHEFERQHFNGRTVARILRLSRTIADMAASEEIGEEHVAEAMQYRQMDRLWT